jgi:hypothetical protein
MFGTMELVCIFFFYLLDLLVCFQYLVEDIHTEMLCLLKAFDEWPTFRQWQSEACKWAGGFTFVTVLNGEIVNIQKMFP